MDPEIIVSSAEQGLRAAGGWRVSYLPERFGADFLWRLPDKRWAGVQRKTMPDFIASLGDRLTKELEQMKGLAYSKLIIEGRIAWSAEGVLMGQWGNRPFRIAEFWGLIDSIQHEAGIPVDFTTDEVQTADRVITFARWTCKGEHKSMAGFDKKKMVKSKWGTAESDIWMLRLLTAFDGVSVTLGKRILAYARERYGAAASPLGWMIPPEELQENVRGIGPTIVTALRALPSIPRPEAPASVADAVPAKTRRRSGSKTP